ncbi:helix-turn-helix domain-containing protein [Ancylobacter radicis]|uniref:Helix-turn-helix domain-containing protein n=1 Tax=Ancylobacter radicis TaxID=2836179 RepID=A0ABS5R1P9_9HYPH|nr:helix-turn-helix domain-containing protein [Ancylobacter radicis]MBS9475541.1 helix-turn-helix domain-containing protein [Ancylobacter radicis]
MSAELISWAWDVPALQPSARLVLLALADISDHVAYSPADPEYLAARTMQSEDVVQRRLREMEDAGLLSRVGKGVRLITGERRRFQESSPNDGRRALYDERITREMEARRHERVVHTEDERKRVVQRAQEVIRSLGGITPVESRVQQQR